MDEKTKELVRRLRWTNTPVALEAADAIEQLAAAAPLPAMPPAAAPKTPRAPRKPRASAPKDAARTGGGND
jgi:hypothetical protein